MNSSHRQSASTAPLFGAGVRASGGVPLSWRCLLSLLLTVPGCMASVASDKEAWKFDQVKLVSHEEPRERPAEPPTLPSAAATALPEEIPSPAASVVAEPLRFSGRQRLEDLRTDQIRPVTLDEIVHTAVESNAIVRDSRQFLSPGNELLVSPEQAPAAFDPAIQASSAGGVDAALAAFDLQAAAGGQWGENALTQSGQFLTSYATPTNILVSRSGSLYGRLDKPMGTGAVASLVHAWNYVPNNLPSQTFNSRFAGFLRGELRQPLAAGRGRDFTEVAGPISAANPVPGRGVAIARIDQSITVAQFDARVQLLIRQTYEAYWELWLAHEIYRAQVAAFDSAQQLRKRVESRAGSGLAGGEAANRAYAEENLFDRQRTVDNALAEVLEAENRLRRLTGMPQNDGQLLLPANPPSLGQVVPDWDGALANAYDNRPELRQQHMRIQSLDLQCRAARNLLRPQLDAIAGVQLNGTGDEIVSGGPDAYGNLFDPGKAGWNVGFEFSMPLGFRLAHARVRNIEQRLSKARVALAAQESEVSHELAHVFHEVDRTYASLETTAGLRDAARRRFKAVEADYDAGRSSLDMLLRTHVAVTEAERAYLESVVAYNKTLIELSYRQGVLLRDHAFQVADADIDR